MQRVCSSSHEAPTLPGKSRAGWRERRLAARWPWGGRFGTLAPVLTPTVAVRLYRPIALALEDLGISAAAVFAEFDMPDPATTGWEVRLPLPQIAGIWARLLEVTADASFALRAAEHVDLTTCDVITYLEGNARTVEAALRTKFEFLPLITNAIEWTLEVSGDEAAITLHERPARPPLAPVAEYLLAARHVFFRRFASPDWALRHVTFRHSAPERLEPYRVAVRRHAAVRRRVRSTLVRSKLARRAHEKSRRRIVRAAAALRRSLH